MFFLAKVRGKKIEKKNNKHDETQKPKETHGNTTKHETTNSKHVFDETMETMSDFLDLRQETTFDDRGGAGAPVSPGAVIFDDTMYHFISNWVIYSNHIESKEV